MNDFLDPNLKKDKGFIFIDLSQKGQKRTRKGLPLEIFWSFCPFKTQNQKNAFSNGGPKKDKKRTRKGPNRTRKGPNCPKKDKGFIFY